MIGSTPATRKSELVEAVDRLDRIDLGDETYMARGMAMGHKQIQDGSRRATDATSRMIVLTDGYTKDEHDAYAWAQQARQAGIVVSTDGPGPGFQRRAAHLPGRRQRRRVLLYRGPGRDPRRLSPGAGPRPVDHLARPVAVPGHCPATSPCAARTASARPSRRSRSRRASSLSATWKPAARPPRCWNWSSPRARRAPTAWPRSVCRAGIPAHARPAIRPRRPSPSRTSWSATPSAPAWPNRPIPT